MRMCLAAREASPSDSCRTRPSRCTSGTVDENEDNDDDDEDDDDDHEEEQDAELALGRRWDWLQLADSVLNVARVDKGRGGRRSRLSHETPFVSIS